MTVLSRPIDLWTLNYQPKISLKNCAPDTTTPSGNRGNFPYTHFVCQPTTALTPPFNS